MDESKWSYPEYQHVSLPILLLFCSYVIIWYLQVGTRISFLGTIRIEFLVASVLIPLAFVTHSKSTINLNTPLLPIIVLYFLLLFLMTIFSYDVQTSWNIFLNRVIKFAFMAFFIVCFVKSPTGMKFFLAAFMLACMKMGQEGLVGQITGGLVWQNQGVMRLHGATMMYRHPNSFSGMALGTLPFILYLFPVVSKWIKALFLVQLVFSLNIILFTGSRTGYLGLIGVILVFFLKSKRKVTILLLLLFAGIVGLNYIPGEYVQRFESIFTQSESGGDLVDPSMEALHGGDSSKEARIQIIRDAVEIFITHPFGVGVAAFPSIRYDTFGRSQDTHNLYLEIATNLGIQGLIIFSLFIYHLYKSLLRTRNKLMLDIKQLKVKKLQNVDAPLREEVMRHSDDLRFILAICESVVLFICVRLLLGMFGMDLYEIYWWFFLGLTLALANIVKIAHGKTSYFLNSIV